ncbi:aromatic amino acid exporter [compost metagenome]
MLQSPTLEQWLTLGYLSLGPLGGAFYLWDHAMKKGDPQEIAVLAYAVPVASTLFVSLFLGRGVDAATIAGAVLVTLAVAIGNRARA